MHGSSSQFLVAESTENRNPQHGYKLAGEGGVQIVAATATLAVYLQYASQTNSRSLQLLAGRNGCGWALVAAWPWQLSRSTSTAQLTTSSVLDPRRVNSTTWAMCQTGCLGRGEAMHERQTCTTSRLDLGPSAAPPVALTATSDRLVTLDPPPVRIPGRATACSPRSLAWSPAHDVLSLARLLAPCFAEASRPQRLLFLC